MSADRSCSFCGKRANEVRALVEGPNVRICDECVELCGEMARPHPQHPPASPRIDKAPIDDTALHCSFCGRREDEVVKLLGGIESFICDECIDNARADLAARGDPVGHQEGELYYCSFCGKSQNDVARIVAGPAVNICSECVALCQQIVQQAAARSSNKTAAGTDSHGNDNTQLYCSFCGEPGADDRRLIAGPTVFICHECVGICVGLCADPPPSDDRPEPNG